MITNLSYDCDVLIIGAGPAGCTAATILAEEKGRKVIVFGERALSSLPRRRIFNSSLLGYPQSSWDDRSS